MFEKAQASRERTSRLLYASRPGLGWALSGGSPVCAPSSPPTDSAPARPTAGPYLRGSGSRAPPPGDPLRDREKGSGEEGVSEARIPPLATSLQVLPISGSPARAARPLAGIAPGVPDAQRVESAGGGGGGRAGVRGGETVEGLALPSLGEAERAT
ncbi:hypothetical protein P7K49_015788 [Saguinus oedipus]|uniref:Uncharacterized protein n=1 Tax=Saguinus oedipus TaxID=9490 RepID=A0ABQ9VA74_SAGOE|nr:hypothetical protein P7K49_015788 [Saguinus oedipus]